MAIKKKIVETSEGPIEVTERSFKDYITLASKTDVTTEDIWRVHIKKDEDWAKLDKLGEEDTKKLQAAVAEFKETEPKK